MDPVDLWSWGGNFGMDPVDLGSWKIKILMDLVDPGSWRRKMSVDIVGPGSRVTENVEGSCGSWILQFLFLVGSCGSWVLEFVSRTSLLVTPSNTSRVRETPAPVFGCMSIRRKPQALRDLDCTLGWSVFTLCQKCVLPPSNIPHFESLNTMC